MANDKKFIAKNGFLTSDADSSFTNSTSATPTVTFTNSGGAGASSLPGSGAVIAKFAGNSDAMVITNVSDGDYFFGNNQQNNGINFYDGTGGMEFFYNGVEKFSIDSNGTTFATGHTTTGTTITDRLKVEDNGSTSPLVVIKGDDASPWALAIGNDTYSTTETMGHLFYQGDAGDAYYQIRGNGVYENWNFQQHDGSTSRTQMRIASTGHIELASNHYVLWGVGDTNRPGLLGDNTNKVLQFHNNGAERMRLDGSGNVGIGTQTATSGRVHVHGGNVRITNTSDVGLKLRHTTATFDFNILQNSNGDLELNYGTTDFVRIKSSGNVGIGSNANNPQYKLDVDGTTRVTGGLTISPGSSGHTSFELGSRSADPLPAATGSYDFKPGMRVGSYELGDINAAANIALAWMTDDISTSSPGYLPASQSYAGATWSESFTVTQVAGTRWFVKVKLNDAESGNDPRLAVNGGTEYRLEYLDAVNASGEAVNDSDTWHVIDVTDDIVTGNNVLKVWLNAGQKTYILAAYVFASTGIALPNEPAESTFYAHDGFGVRDRVIIDKNRDMTNINSVRFETPSTSGGNKNYFANVGTGGQDYWIMSTSDANGSLGGGKFVIGTDAVSGNNADQTRLLIDSIGNVGIGDTNPADKFTIKGDGARMTISSNDYEVAMLGRRGSTAPNWDRGYLRMKYDGTNTIVLDTGGVSYLNGGNVGIGTETPQSSSKLHVNKTLPTGTLHYDGYSTVIVTDTESRLQLMSTDGGTNASTLLLSNGIKHWGLHHHGPTGSNVFSIGYRTSAATGEDITNNLSDVFNITTGGNVGIGTTSPAGNLSILSNNPNIRFDDSDTSNNGEITLDNTSLRIESDPDNAVANSTIKFNVDNDTKMIVLSDGNVGIGTATPGNRLHVYESGMVGPDPVVKVNAFYQTDSSYNGHGSIMQLTTNRGDGFSDGYLLDVQNSDGIAMKIRGDRKTIFNPGNTDYQGNQTGVVYKTLQIHDEYDAAGTHWTAYANLDGNWQDGAAGADSQHGWIFGHSNNVRGGLIYDHRGIERMALWSSYGKIDFLIADAADGNGVPIDSNINEAMTIIPGGNIGIGTTAPTHKLHVESTIVNASAPDFPVLIAQVDYANAVNQLGGSGVGIQFNPATNSADAVGGAIAAINTSASDDVTDTALAFYTSDNDTTLDEKMRISPDGVVDFYGTDGGLASAGKLERIQSAYFVNNEDDQISTTLSQTNGARLYFDHNFYSDQTAFSNIFSGDGGGFAYYGGDQLTWTAIYDTYNTQYAEGTWRNLKIGANQVWHAGNDGAGSGLDADNLDGVTWGNINTTLQTSSNIKAYNGTTEIKSDGIYFESGTHCITWNDGRGNFNVRVGHDVNENVTETGYASHIEWSQSSGWMQLSGTTSSRTTGTAITWSNENVWQWTFSNGQFSSPGDVVAYSSDRRLKTNITNIDNALDKVLKLNGVHFNWADDIHERGFHGAAPGEKAVGVIAQEVEAVLPELVAPAPFDALTDEETGEYLGSKSGEDYKTVKYEKLTALLIEAVKELSAKVDSQQEEIDRLKGL